MLYLSHTPLTKTNGSNFIYLKAFSYFITEALEVKGCYTFYMQVNQSYF